MNDWTARDLQAAEMQGPLGPCKGKDFATSLGPWLLTADEVPGLAHGDDRHRPHRGSRRHRLRHRLLSSMAWSFAELVAYASRGTRFRPATSSAPGPAGTAASPNGGVARAGTSAASLRPGSLVALEAGPLGKQTARVQRARQLSNPLRDRRAITE